MDQDYIQNRVHDILVGQIAMGAAVGDKRKKKAAKKKVAKKKVLKVKDFTKHDIQKFKDMSAADKKDYFAGLRAQGYIVAPGVILALNKLAKGGEVIGCAKPKRKQAKKRTRKSKAGAVAGARKRGRKPARKSKAGARAGVSAGAKNKIINAGYKKALQDCIKALALLKKAK